ncbi:helix-turn-helix transcriptional regulator [Deltaproteobacteria bacterium TL4]
MAEKNFRDLLGEIVNTARLEKGLTQKELGIELGYLENSAGQIVHKIEEGKIGIPKKKINHLLKILGITHESMGLDPSISLPIWISSEGKKGSGFTFQDFLATAESVVTGIVGISGTVASGVAEVSETIVKGVHELSETVREGAEELSDSLESNAEEFAESTIQEVSNIATAHGRLLHSLMKEIVSKKKKIDVITKAEQLEIIEVLCKSDQKKIDKIRQILEI